MFLTQKSLSRRTFLRSAAGVSIGLPILDAMLPALKASQLPGGKTPVRAKSIKTAMGAHAFRALGDKRHLLVSNRVANTVSRIDLQTMAVVDTFAAPGGPDCMDVSRDGKQLLVTSRWARKLTVIDMTSKKIVRQINVGKSPHGVWTLDHAPR